MASTQNALKHGLGVNKKPKKFALLVRRQLFAVTTPVVMKKCSAYGVERQRWRGIKGDLCRHHRLTCHAELLL